MTSFEKFIAPAKEKPEFWRIFAVLGIWLAIYILSTGVMGFVSSDLGRAAQSGRFDNPESVIGLLVTFIPWVIGLLFAVFVIHRRGLLSLIGQPLARVGKHLLLSMVIFGGIVFIAQWLSWPGANAQESLASDQWRKFLPLGVALVFIQITAEELLFRGYLLQQLAARFKSRWVFIFLPSALFGLLHYSSENGPLVGALIVLATGLSGIILSEITYRTGTLGWALGIHFTNNLQAMFWISYQEELSGLARYVVPDAFSDFDNAIAILAPQLAIMLVFYAIYFFVMERRQARIET